MLNVNSDFFTLRNPIIMMRKVKQPAAMTPDPELPARERLLLAGGALFAKNGFESAAVRDICALANTTSNMIHYYFGSKQGLYDEFLLGFSERVLMVPIRIISGPPKNRETLIAKLEMFIAETLEALVDQPDLFKVVIREQFIFEAFETYNLKLIEFLESAKKLGIVREKLDTAMLTGLILDRLGSQILYATWIKETSGENVMDDSPYKKRWLSANIDLILHGILTS